MSIFKAVPQIVHHAMMAGCKELPTIVLEFPTYSDAAGFIMSVRKEALPEDQMDYSGGDTFTLNGVVVKCTYPSHPVATYNPPRGNYTE